MIASPIHIHLLSAWSLPVAQDVSEEVEGKKERRPVYSRRRATNDDTEVSKIRPSVFC